MDEEKFKALLEDQHEFPTAYTFKFIVEKDYVGQIEALFDADEVTLKPSKGGKYMSITAKPTMQTSDEVLMVYRKAYEIKGVISL